ncbi:MAG: hypothetical protein ACTSWW_01315 [Promethearchaeota archaeon]
MVTGIMLSVQVSLSYASEDAIETVVWEYGENGAVFGYTKTTLLSESNDSVYYIEIDKYDALGDLTAAHSDNQSGGFLWKSPTDLDLIKSEGGYLENLTIVGKNITVVVYVLVYDQQTTFYRYCEQSGVLVTSQSQNGNEEFYNLISWEDLDVKVYADEQNQFISAYPLWSLIVSFACLVALVKRKNQTR